MENTIRMLLALVFLTLVLPSSLAATSYSLSCGELGLTRQISELQGHTFKNDEFIRLSAEHQGQAFVSISEAVGNNRDFYYRGMRVTPEELVHILRAGFETSKTASDEIHYTGSTKETLHYALGPRRAANVNERHTITNDSEFVSVVIAMRREGLPTMVSWNDIPASQIAEVWIVTKAGENRYSARRYLGP